MTVSVFLGGFGFGNLGDEACLATSLKLYRGGINCCFTHDPNITRKAGKFDFFFSKLQSLLEKYEVIDKVIIAGGGVGFMPSFRDNIDWAMHCKNRGAKVYIHNIGIGGIGRSWCDSWPYLVPVVADAEEFSVRDYASYNEVISWGLNLNPTISYYPERNHEIDPTLPIDFPNKPLLGLSINNTVELWDAINRNEQPIRTALRRFVGHDIVPIVSTCHALDNQERDDIGVKRFCEKFGLANHVIDQRLWEHDFWYREMSPGRIKYAVSKCSHLISARKHNIIHAIGAGVPFTALHDFRNDSIPRVYGTLFDIIPANSSLFPLYG